MTYQMSSYFWDAEYIQYQDQRATASENEALTRELEVYWYSLPHVPRLHMLEVPDELNSHAHTYEYHTNEWQIF